MTPAAPAAAVPPSVPAPVADAAPVADTTTFLFTDIESSTAEWETAADMPTRLDRHLTLLREAVVAFGGVVFSSMGDGIAAAFPSAGAAVHAAVAAQRVLPQSGLRARMGIHTGEARRVGDDYRGRPVNRAARIMALGHGGQILVSDLCAALVRSGPDPVALSDLGVHRLRGLADGERLWQVVDPGIEARFAPVRSATPARPPCPRTTLVGREREVGRVTDLVGRVPVVTLVGPGGVGKTHLARHVLDLLPPAVAARVVELAPVPAGAPAEEVARAMATGLGLTVGAGADPIAAVAGRLDQEDGVVVVDSCEHVVDGAAEVIGALIETSRRVTVVATSREPLGLDGEHLVRVRPLRPGPAAALFRLRAEAAGLDPDAVDDEPGREIVRRLDGLPLAIELAAARAGALGLPALLDGLRRCTPLAGRGRRGRADRHATMDATIAWSYDLLGRSEQTLVGWLAVFPDGAELDAVVHVAGRIGLGPAAATEVLASLVERSMVIADPQPHGTRYRILQTMRPFMEARLDASGERAAAGLALADWVASIADRPLADPGAAAVQEAALRLEREAGAWRVAMATAAEVGRAELAARLCGPPTAFFLLGRPDLAASVRSVVDLCRTARRPRQATLCALMVATAETSAPERLRADAEEVAALDDPDPTGLGALMLWLARLSSGDVEGAVAACLAGADDPRLAAATRDLLLAIAVLDRYSLTGATADADGLVERALACADRSPVALTRSACRLGAAWALAPVAPDRSVALVQQALADLDDVPALTRLTIPGSAFQLLATLQPRDAARGLLDQLDAVPARRSPVDLVPLAYARSLLDRVAHPAAAPHPSMVDVVAEARRLAAPGGRDVGAVEAGVRRALAEIATDGACDGAAVPA